MIKENYRQAEEEHKAQIPDLTKEWIDKGHSVLDQKYWDDWDNCVPVRLGDLYRGMELGACLDIVKSLNDGCTMDEAERIIESQGHSGLSFSLVKAMVKHFCDRGNEFSDFLDNPSLGKRLTEATERSANAENNEIGKDSFEIDI